MGAVYTEMKCLGEAFAFSAWRAFASVVLASLSLFPVLLIVVATVLALR